MDIEEDCSSTAGLESNVISRRLERKAAKCAGIVWMIDFLFIVGFLFFYTALSGGTMQSSVQPVPTLTAPPTSIKQQSTLYIYFLTSEGTKIALMISDIVIVHNIDECTTENVKQTRKLIKIVTGLRLVAGQMDYLMLICGGFSILQNASVVCLAFGGALIILQVAFSFGSIYLAKKTIDPLNEFLEESGEAMELVSMSGKESSDNEAFAEHETSNV